MQAKHPQFSITYIPYPRTSAGNIWGDYSYLVVIASRFSDNDRGLTPPALYAKMSKDTGSLTPISETEFREESANIVMAFGSSVQAL